MRPRSLDAEVDKLYQLPLDDFTAARNALAREAGGGEDIRRLPKPPVAAWAVNQLYWKNREVYDALVEAADELRGAHKAVLGGRRGDLRIASKMHDEALDRALKATLQLLEDSGHSASDATRQAVLNTLRALPSTDPPGRLGRTLQPGGFEMLANLPVAAGKRSATTSRSAPPPAPPPRAGARQRESRAARDERAAEAARRSAARQAVAEATRDAREADMELRRQEFAAARAAKEAANAARRLEQAREALVAAQRDAEEAERAAGAADKAREKAARASADAQAAAAQAHARLEAAEDALNELGSD